MRPGHRLLLPNLFLRVVERRTDGVVVCGAKLHQTGMLNAHEMLVMPTMGMKAGEEVMTVFDHALGPRP